MAEGEILISIDTDGFIDPKLWGVVNSHFFSRTNGHPARPILVLFLNGRRWNFDFRQHRSMDSLTQNCGGLLIRIFFLGPMETKLVPFWCFFLMAEGVILIMRHRLIPWPKIVAVVNSHFFSRTNGHQARPIWCFFLMAEGEILIYVDTDGFLDPKLWGVVNSHFFSRTYGHQVWPIFVLFHNGRKWNFDSVDTDGYLDPKL